MLPAYHRSTNSRRSLVIQTHDSPVTVRFSGVRADSRAGRNRLDLFAVRLIAAVPSAPVCKSCDGNNYRRAAAVPRNSGSTSSTWTEV
jgi:hypothetical protein